MHETCDEIGNLWPTSGSDKDIDAGTRRTHSVVAVLNQFAIPQGT